MATGFEYIAGLCFFQIYTSLSWINNLFSKKFFQCLYISNFLYVSLDEIIWCGKSTNCTYGVFDMIILF